MNTTTQPTHKYKNSPLGLIPEDWEVKKLGDIGKIRMCKRIFNHETSESGDIPFYKIGTFGKNADAFIPKEIYLDYKDRFSYPKTGDILISAAGTIGRTVRFDGCPAYFQDSNIVWIDNNEMLLTNDYLYYIYKIVKYDTEGGTIQRLYNSIISNAKFPLPPLPEQTAIANCLSTWDNAIEKHTALIAQKELSKKALMQQLLSGKKRLKGFSGEWREYKISDFGKIETGNTPSMIIPEYYGDEFCWATATDFNGVYIKETKIKLSAKGVKVARLIPKGSVLITCIASIGKNAIAGVDLAFNQQINSITPNDSFNSEFIYYLIENSNHKLTEVAGAGAVPIINKTSFSNIKLIAPQIEEQTAIATILQCADTEIQLLKTKLAQLKEQKKGLMQVLLTGKKRLKIK